MTIWALLFTLSYVPGWTDWAFQSGWAYILLTVPWMVRGSNLPRASKILGLACFGWALFSLTRLGHWWFGGEQVMQLFCIGLVAMLASNQPDLRKITRGLAIGVSIGVIFAGWYAWGWGSQYHGIVPTVGKPAGLFYNSAIFGDVCAVVILLLLVYRDYWFIPLLALGLVLSDSRGAGLALVIGVIAWIAQERRWALLLFLGLAIPGGYAILAHGFSDSIRETVWHYVLGDLRWLGHGAGRLEEIGMLLGGRIYVIEYAHNEFLDLAYSYGVGAILFIALALGPLACYRSAEWPAYVAFISTALWAFPFHYPPEAIVGAMVAGALYSRWALSWSGIRDSGPRLAAWYHNRQLLPDPAWWGYFPYQSSSMEKRTP